MENILAKFPETDDKQWKNSSGPKKKESDWSQPSTPFSKTTTPVGKKQSGKNSPEKAYNY